MLVSIILPITFIAVEKGAEAIADHSRQPRARGEASKLNEIAFWGLMFSICRGKSFARAQIGQSPKKSWSGNAELA